MIQILSTQLANGQTVDITPATATICAGSGTSTTLQANPAGGIVISYLWSNNSTSSTIDVSPLTTTTYTVTATFVGGTTSNASATITVIPQPAQATITPVGPTTVCTGTNVQLDASAGDSWQWYLNGSSVSGATSQTYFAPAGGDYTVLVTVGSCNAPMSTSTTATIIAPPVANVSPSGPLDVCYGNSITLTADPVSGATYQWQYSPNGFAPWADIAGETNQTYDATVSGYNRVYVAVGACGDYSH
jgi:hypothetical protein